MNKPSFTKRPNRPVTPKSKPKVCDHSYQVLEEKIETIYADGHPEKTYVYAVFFCKKCLDIRCKNETINNLKEML